MTWSENKSFPYPMLLLKVARCMHKSILHLILGVMGILGKYQCNVGMEYKKTVMKYLRGTKDLNTYIQVYKSYFPSQILLWRQINC